MSGARVTIGVPVYNGAGTLPAAIAAIAAQTEPRLRILVSDDGSTDASPALLAAWAARDPRVEVIRQPRNLGTIAHYDWLARSATTPYFMYAAQDDAWSADYTQRLADLLEREPGADLAAGSNRLMSQTWQPLRLIGFAAPTGPRIARVRAMLRIARSSWFYGLYRTPALLAALPRVERYGDPWGHDFVTLLPFLLSARVALDDRAVFEQRVTTLSEGRYKPLTVAREWRLYCDFTAAARDALAASPLAPAERLAVTPFLMKYVARHTTKLRVMAQHAVMEAVGGRPATRR